MNSHRRPYWSTQSSGFTSSRKYTSWPSFCKPITSCSQFQTIPDETGGLDRTAPMMIFMIYVRLPTPHSDSQHEVSSLSNPLCHPLDRQSPNVAAPEAK